MFLGNSHHILNFHVKQTSWIWILRNRHFLNMVAQYSIEVSSCPALITHIGRKWTRLQHWGLPYKCTSSFFFFFCFKIQTPFGFGSGFVLHFNCGDAQHSQNTSQIFKFSYESHLEGPEKQATPSSYTSMQPALSFGPGLQHTFVIKTGSKQNKKKLWKFK